MKFLNKDKKISNIKNEKLRYIFYILIQIYKIIDGFFYKKSNFFFFFYEIVEEVLIKEVNFKVYISFSSILSI